MRKWGGQEVKIDCKPELCEANGRMCPKKNYGIVKWSEHHHVVMVSSLIIINVQM